MLSTRRRTASSSIDDEAGDVAAGTGYLPAGHSQGVWELSSGCCVTSCMWPAPSVTVTQRPSALAVFQQHSESCLDNNFRRLNIVAYFIEVDRGDVCDGPSNNRPIPVSIFDRVQGFHWTPTELSENSEVGIGDVFRKTFAWRVTGRNNLFVFGFEDNNKKVYFVEAEGEGSIMLSEGADGFDGLTESQAQSDPRVFQLKDDKLSGFHTVVSFANPKLYINLISNRLRAERVSKEHATAWKVQPK